jgi:hypothetical protein
MVACENDDNLSPEESKVKSETAANANSEMLAVTQEVLDVTSMALLEKGVSNGRISSSGRLSEHGFNCYPTISASYDVKKSADSIVYAGLISIDFGDGSSCEDSTKVRSGKITDAFRYVISYNDSIPFKSSETISFENYKKDSVQLDGTFNSTFSGGSYTIHISDAMLTYPDATSANWSGMLVYEYDSKGTPHWKDDSKTLTGSLNGITRLNDSFSADIVQEILFSYECEGKHDVPVSGVIDIITSGSTAEVNYGNGTCDKIYTVTTNGESTEYTFGPKGS